MRSSCLKENLDRNEAWLARAHLNGFNILFRDQIHKSRSCIGEELQNLAIGPLFMVTSYEGYDINGYTFYTMVPYKKSMYQISGVHIYAFDNTSKQKDAYYGQVHEIWELTYPGFKVPIF